MRKSLLAVFIGIFLHGCATTKTTCINERTLETIIRWGDGEMEKGSYSGYEIHADDLGVYIAQRSKASDGMSIKRVDSISAEVFCGRLQEVIQTFTTIQSLYSPGKTYRSVEYINTKTNVHKKAIWNPEFTTFGSKEFREIHDSLMLLTASKLIK